MNPHLTALEAAYQLHYYLWFKTHYLQPFLASTDRQQRAKLVIADTCERHDYDCSKVISIRLTCVYL